MIVSKYSALLGFAWFLKLILKIIASVYCFADGEPFAVFIGIMLLCIAAYEGVKEFRDKTDESTTEKKTKDD